MRDRMRRDFRGEVILPLELRQSRLIGAVIPALAAAAGLAYFAATSDEGAAFQLTIAAAGVVMLLGGARQLRRPSYIRLDRRGIHLQRGDTGDLDAPGERRAGEEHADELIPWTQIESFHVRERKVRIGRGTKTVRDVAYRLKDRPITYTEERRPSVGGTGRLLSYDEHPPRTGAAAQDTRRRGGRRRATLRAEQGTLSRALRTEADASGGEERRAARGYHGALPASGPAGPLCPYDLVELLEHLRRKHS
jgi:hypothetical protein